MFSNFKENIFNKNYLSETQNTLPKNHTPLLDNKKNFNKIILNVLNKDTISPLFFSSEELVPSYIYSNY